MAKGKYGLQAARRRAESAEGQHDRLVEQLTDAKMKARRYEADASSVPLLRRRVATLEADLGAATSAEVRRLEDLVASLQREKDEAVAELAARQKKWEALTTRLLDYFGGGIEAIDIMSNLLGINAYLLHDDGLAKMPPEAQDRIGNAQFAKRHGRPRRYPPANIEPVV